MPPQWSNLGKLFTCIVDQKLQAFVADDRSQLTVELIVGRIVGDVQLQHREVLVLFDQFI